METEKIYWNRGWEFYPQFYKEQSEKNYKGETPEEVIIPHTFTETPYHYFDENCYQKDACYRRIFCPRQEWEGKQVLLTIDGAAHSSEVYVNGEKIAAYKNGYMAFVVNLSPYLRWNENNVIAIRVNSKENQNIPPFGKVIDYMTYGGIYREIFLTVKEEEYIEDLFICNEKAEKERAEFQAKVRLKFCEGKKAEVKLSIVEEGKLKGGFSAAEGGRVCGRFEVEDITLWDLENPKLYTIRAELYAEGEKRDVKEVRVGFRTTEFREDGFYLNGRKIKLRGLNRHQSYPYVGYAMPKRVQRRDADILKYELALNAVRTSHYPQSHDFLNRCDEIGLLVFTEIPGWQHIGDEEWKKQACRNVRDMVIQYRNHASIILWGVRINESQDDDELYQKTNDIAHELDTSRSTGGVRFLQKSHLLEDVYTYNDFLHNGTNKGAENKKKVTPDMAKAYLVSEYNGHMFPTKSFDNEEHRVEHALRHARVLQEINRQEDIVGGFGWCMCDYNTHKDFGSGDRICYHGVLDMFRNKKLAAYVYESQGEERPVFEISSAMDIGEYPACSLGTVYAFTNADSVKVYKNDAFVREFFPDKEAFGALEHPPVKIDDFIGELLEKGEGFSKKKAEAIKEVLLAIQKYGQNSLPVRYYFKMLRLMAVEHMTAAQGYELYSKYVANWGDVVTTYRFEAIKDGKIVGEIKKSPCTKTELDIQADTTVLTEEETIDVASVRFVMRDENKNLLSYYQEPVELKTEGVISLIGPSICSLKGGMGGTYVKTNGKSGKGTLFVTTSGVTKKLVFEVSAASFADKC